MRQKFGSCISKRRVDQLKLDFIRSDDLNFFRQRYRFYDALIKKIFLPKWTTKAYLAGSILIDYNPNCQISRNNPTEIARYQSEKRFHLYLKISAERDFRSNLRRASRYFKSEYAEQPRQNDIVRGSTDVYCFDVR
jgi:hypothetical protein